MKILNRKSNSVFKKFSLEENAVWQILATRRRESLRGLALPIHTAGWRKLGMSTRCIPDFNIVNKKLKKLSGWQVDSTGVQYEEDHDWLSSLAKKKLRVTEYIRDRKNLDYTPLPDVFHDVFGHLPYLANKQYARIAHKFGLAYVAAPTKRDKLKIANNWWYGIEFSFLKVKDKLRPLGTGLVSSEGELANALSDKVEKLPYDAEVVGAINRSAHEYHTKLFILESLEQLEKTVDEYFTSFTEKT